MYMVYVRYMPGTFHVYGHSVHLHIHGIYVVWYKWVFSKQDCLATIPPYPFYIGERDDNYDVAESLYDPDSMCFVRPQLFFHCTPRPIGTVAGSYNRSDEHILLYLVFFSPYEQLRLKTAGIMESKEIHRVY
jgi:hypothetical protein